MKEIAIKRPAIPVELYRPSILGMLGFISYAFLLFVVPGVAGYLVMSNVHSTGLMVALLLPCIIAGGLGAHLLGWMGHDGTHLSLHPNKYVSVTLGLFFSAMLVTYMEMGFAFEHWNHHRYCNKSKDPDIKVLSRLKTWWQRILFTRIVYNLNYAKILFRVILKKPLGFHYKLPFKEPALRAFCWLNLVFSLFWLGVYIALTLYDWRIFPFCVLAPTLVGLVLSGSQSYIDHAGTESDALWANSRTRISTIATVLWFGGNYHLEHHLYPGVPAYRLPKVHRILREQGVIEQAKPPIEHGFWGIYRHLKKPYVATDVEDGSFDPHDPIVRGTYS